MVSIGFFTLDILGEWGYYEIVQLQNVNFEIYYYQHLITCHTEKNNSIPGKLFLTL